MTDFFGYGKGEETVYTCPKDYCRIQYYEAIDAVINCIENRFDQEDYQMYGLLEQVLLRAAKGESYVDELAKVIEFYHDDLDEFVLKSQLQTFSTNYASDGIVSFASIRKYLQSLSPAMKSLLSQVVRMAKLVLVAATTNATSERSFSALRRAKSYLQNTMGQQRLNNIMVLHVHKERTDQLNLVNIANNFIRGSDSRNLRF